MKYLRLCLVIISLFFNLVSAQAGEMPTISGVCQLQGDWCTTNCQVAGGRDGRCNKVGLCVCSPL